jgi:hypothetical protein
MDDAARSKTLDYKASFHILDPNPQGIDSEDAQTNKVGDFLMQNPPKFNLTDVMG